MTRKAETLEGPTVIDGEAVDVTPTSAVAVYDPQRQGAIFALGTMSDQEFTQHVAVLHAGIERIRQLQRSLLTKGTDFDTLEGTGDRVVLLKPGAEKLASFASLVPVFRHHLDIASFEGRPDRITYTVECDLHYGSADGPMVGSGIGVCSSWEKKYHWRDGKQRCPECGQPSILKSKDKPEYFCWRKIGGCGRTFKLDDARITSQPTGKVENDEPYEQINTYAKMAEKRSHVDAVIRTLNASSLFTQDVGPTAKGDDDEDWGGMDTQAPERAQPPHSRTRQRQDRAAAKDEAKAATQVAEVVARDDDAGFTDLGFDDPEVDHRATGERGTEVSFDGEVVRATWDATPTGNPYVRAVVKSGDDYYHSLIATDTAAEVGITGEPVKGEKVGGVTDGQHVMVTGRWQTPSEGPVVIVDGWA